MLARPAHLAHLPLADDWSCSPPHHARLSSILQHIIPLHTSTGEAVMMGWETPLMQRHAAAICGAKRGTGDFLNVGFGLGIIDREIQAWAASQRDGVAPQPAACVHTLQRTLSDTSCCSLQGTPVCLRSAPTAIFVAPLPAVPNCFFLLASCRVTARTATPSSRRTQMCTRTCWQRDGATVLVSRCCMDAGRMYYQRLGRLTEYSLTRAIPPSASSSHD